MRYFILIAMWFYLSCVCAQVPGLPKLSVPLDANTAIIDAFKSYSVVALGEGDHGNEQSHAFRLQLLRDARFSSVVNDIVVEFGNARYQDVMDRYVRGDEVSRRELRQVWENTGVAGSTWDRPIYEEFFRAVRELNSQLPETRQLRVLLGEAPIDWDAIRNWSDYSKYKRDDAFPAGLILRDVIAKERKVLVIYGDLHFSRKKEFYPLKDMAMAEQRYAMPVGSLVTHLEEAGTPVFSVATCADFDLTTIQPDIAKWTPPKLALLKDTALGAVKSTMFFGNNGYVWIITDREQAIEERTRADLARSPAMQEQFNAILYLGPKSAMTRSKLPPELCKDEVYMNMRIQRLTIADPWDKNPGTSLKEYCASLPMLAQ